jgi:general secretion pathway protein G
MKLSPEVGVRRGEPRAAPDSTSAVVRRLTFRVMKPASRTSRLPRHHGLEAFTLLEILVVLGIIVLLFSLVVANITGMFTGAKHDIAKLFVTQSLKAPLNVYQIHMGDFPSTAEGLQALITAPANKADRWRGPYLEEPKIPVDPWGEPYQYRFPGVKNKTNFDLWSKGPDKTDGTEDDIGNW